MESLSKKNILNNQIKHIVLDNSIDYNSSGSLDLLLKQIGDSRYVLLGEASHGTHEYYTIRARLSQKLIEEKGFSFIAVEGDWPDCYRLNRYVKNYPGSGKSAYEVLQSFNRWPTWMWANWEIIALIEWMKKHNKDRKKRVGFYGLDVYSLWESMDSIINYLDKTDKKAKHTAINAYKCFEPFGKEGQSYAVATRMVPQSCEFEVVELLTEIRKNIMTYNHDPEAVFSTEQNAYVIYNAEKYYRTMLSAGPDAWNIRDQHMTDTLFRLMEFHGPGSKGIIWEHNTHIGDARATDMKSQGMINVGQLVNETKENDGVYTIGFGSYSGKVTAARKWGEQMMSLIIPHARPGSWESILHDLGSKDRIILMNDSMKEILKDTIVDHRAIGVVYNPEYEKFGNYVPSKIHQRYNAFIFIDETSPLHPLHVKPDGHQMPETYPFGL